MVDIKYWAAFRRIPSLGTERFRRLEAYFGDFEKAWNSGQAEFKSAGLDDWSARDPIDLRGETSLEAKLEKVHRAGIKLVTWHDDDYPVRLKEIADPPPMLYSIRDSVAFRRKVDGSSSHQRDNFLPQGSNSGIDR